MAARLRPTCLKPSGSLKNWASSTATSGTSRNWWPKRSGVCILLGAALIALAFHFSGIERLGHPSLDFLVRPWLQPTGHDLLLMALCGVIAAVAMSLLTHAYRSAEANLVTTFEYTGMIWAPLWGFVFFMEIPGWSTILGTALIIAAGVFAMRGTPRSTAAPANADS